MKGNRKRLAVLAVIAALAVGLPVALASAEDPDEWQRGIQGQYAATGMSQCVMAPAGFTIDQTPDGPPGLWSYGIGSWDVVFTFHKHGTGSVAGLIRNNDLAGPALVPTLTPTPSYWHANVSYQFTYILTHEGKITFTAVPNTYKVDVLSGPNKGAIMYLDAVPRDGVISKDGKSIIISCGPPLLLNVTDPDGSPLGPQVSCAASLVLIQLHDTIPWRR